MGFAINILALLLVMGMCWFAMVWLGGRFHGHSEIAELDELGDFRVSGSEPAPSERDVVTGLAPPSVKADACATCEGVGATQTRGKLQPCPVCEGTGVAG